MKIIQAILLVAFIRASEASFNAVFGFIPAYLLFGARPSWELFFGLVGLHSFIRFAADTYRKKS